MSKLDELIQQFCSDGVKYKILEDVLIIKNGRDYKQFGEGEIPVYGSGGIMGYIDTAAYDKPSVLIPRKGSLDKLYYVDSPFWNVDTIFYTDIDTSLVLPKYVYYWLSGQHLERLNKAGGVPSLTQSVLNKVPIPVPPLEVQQEIVRILDQFIELTTELTAELKSELTARKRQHKYHALSLINGTHDVKQVSLSCLGTWYGGCTPSMANPSFWTNGNIPWVSSKDMKTPILTDTQNHLTTEALAQTPIKLFPKNTVAIVARSGILKHTLPVAFIPFETTVNQDIKVLVVSHGVEPRYIYHVLNTNSDDILKKAKKQGGTVDSLDIKKFMEYTVPLPTLSEQLRIVSLLDRFDILYNDLICKLTAEIEAHQKRYEYYRDKLLNFGELG